MNIEPIRKRAGWLVFALSFLVYILTLCPTVYWDDAGELIAASYTLGIPHPPGHPLYVMLGKAFTLIPAGSVAWRVNLMSAFFGSLTCVLIYKIICERLKDSSWRMAAAICGSFFFAFAPTFWDQATVAETSTLHSFFMMLLTLLAFRLASGEILWKTERRSLLLFSFLYGLSLTNHVAGIFFFPAFAFILIWKFRKRVFAPKLLACMLASSFVGLLPYAYLPLRSLSNPGIDWGNPENLHNFLWVVTARQYAPNLVGKLSLLTIGTHLYLHAIDLLHQFTLIGCALGLIGFGTLYRSEKRVVVFSLLVIGVLFYVSLNSAFISAYFIPALALMAVWIGVGLHKTCAWITHLSERIGSADMAVVMRSAVCSILAATFILPLGMHYKNMDRSDDFYALRYGEKLLEQLPEDSAFFTVDGHGLFTLWYLIYCEGRRPDLKVMEPTWLSSTVLRSQILEGYPDLALPNSKRLDSYISRGEDGISRQYLIAQAVMDTNWPIRNIYWGGLIPPKLPFERNLVPHGIVCSYYPRPVALDDKALSQNRKFWESEIEASFHDPAMMEDKTAQEIYPVELNNQGQLFERLGRYDLAEWATNLALKFNPDFPISRYNLGRLRARTGRYEEAIEEYQKAIDGNPTMAVAYFNMGNAYKNLSRFPEAFLAYRKAVRFYPRYHEAITALGQLYLLVGQTEDAGREFRKALEIEPTYAFAERGLATVYLHMGRLDDAKEALDRSFEQDPSSAPGFYALAKYYARVGLEDEAANALKRSVRTGGNLYLENAASDDDLRNLAESLSADGDKR